MKLKSIYQQMGLPISCYICNMLHRFPPPPSATDATFLTSATETFAKLKHESAAGKRTVLMTEHTLIFVLKGMKLLHFANETVRVSPGEVFLLRKGIYVMAEYIEESRDYEALMLFLPDKLLRSMAAQSRTNIALPDDRCLIFPATTLVDAFKESFRQYFSQPPRHLETLMPLKQQEILWLLLSGPQGHLVQAFIHAALRAEPTDIDHIVREYLLQPVSVAELASLSNCSLAKFKRDFQHRYKCAPRQWINQQRLQHARMLLQNTSKQVAEITMDCGFESTSYFIRLYKSCYGNTPAQERAKITID